MVATLKSGDRFVFGTSLAMSSSYGTFCRIGCFLLITQAHIECGQRSAAELDQVLTEPRLQDLDRARNVLRSLWPFLSAEPDLDDDLRKRAIELEDLLERETFYRELPRIDQHASVIESDYKRRYDQALKDRINAYSQALGRLTHNPAWKSIDTDQQNRLAAPFERGMTSPVNGAPIPQLRSEADACEARLRDAIAELYRIVDGERIATVRLGSYFTGGIETEEQLDAALGGIREECARLIGAGKKVIAE